jgi:hypothetical protein
MSAARQTDVGDIGGVEGFGRVTFLGVEDDQPAPRLRLGRLVKFEFLETEAF